MKQQELFYPDISVQIGNYVLNKGISLKTYSDSKSPFDWGKLSFTNPYKEKISIADNDEIVISLGYDGELQETFIGNLVTGYDGYQALNEIMFKDRMLLLEKAFLAGTFKDCTPQEIIREGLRLAGIEAYKLSDKQYSSRAMVSIKNMNMIQVLKRINSIWGIDTRFGFIKGVFYWGVVPEQDEVVEFEYGNNIISLGRANGMWELVTVSIPSIQHSQKIKVSHPKVSGTFEVSKIFFATNEAGFIRTTIYFEE